MNSAKATKTATSEGDATNACANAGNQIQENAGTELSSAICLSTDQKAYQGLQYSTKCASLTVIALPITIVTRDANAPTEAIAGMVLSTGIILKIARGTATAETLAVITAPGFATAHSMKAFALKCRRNALTDLS